jgi:membrane protein implicated in regulation of membrane protease activity
MLSAWHLWVILAIILFIAEVFSPAFILASFGIGCLLASLSAGLDLGLKMQILGFIAGTLAAFFAVRPFFTKYCYKAASGIRTNVDALAGKVGRVTETIDGERGSGRVMVGGDDWKAIAADGNVIEMNSRVEVIKVEGIKVIVKPMPTPN